VAVSRILPGRLYQFSGITLEGLDSHITMWDTHSCTWCSECVQRVKVGDTLLVLGHVRELVTHGDWWLHVLCNGVPGYVKKIWVRGRLTEVGQ